MHHTMRWWSLLIDHHQGLFPKTGAMSNILGKGIFKNQFLETGHENQAF